MRVTVTGAAGFIGSQLCEAMLAEGHEVVGLDNFDDFYDPERKRRNLASATTHPEFRLVEADAGDSGAVRPALDGSEALVHLAARAGVRPSFEAPNTYVQANVVATCNLLAAVTSLEIPRLVFISSSSVYGDGAESPFREDRDTGVPKSPYAATKIAGEALCRAYSHRIPHLSVLRLFSVFGPRQRPDLAIQTFARCIRAGEPVPVLGSTSSFRDYTYVDDIVSGIMASLALEEPWAVLNLGSGRPVVLEDMISRLEEAFGRRVERKILPAHPGDLFGTEADISAAERALGYRPEWTFERGVQRFAEWFVQEADGPVGAEIPSNRPG